MSQPDESFQPRRVDVSIAQMHSLPSLGAYQPNPAPFMGECSSLDQLLDALEKDFYELYHLGHFPDLDVPLNRASRHTPRTMISRDTRLAFSDVVEAILSMLKSLNDSLCEDDLVSQDITDAEALDKLSRQLKGMSVFICAGGRYNTGKSTLLNALLHEDVLPTSPDAETAAAVFIQHSENKPTLTDLKKNSVVAYGVESIRSYLETTNRNLRSLAPSKQPNEFLLQMPVEVLSSLSGQNQIRLFLVDMPGSNEVCQQRLSHMSTVNMETAAAHIYVMSYDQLRNEQDYEALKKLKDKDVDIFRDGRLTVVVTQYDRSYEGSRGSATSEDAFDIQYKLSRQIQTALGVQVATEIVVPVSGLWAYQARMCQSSEGSIASNDVRLSLMSLKRRDGREAMESAMRKSSSLASLELEESSGIKQLERRILGMKQSAYHLWVKNMTKSSFHLLDNANGYLDELEKKATPDLKQSTLSLSRAHNLSRLYHDIVTSIRRNSPFLTELRECYKEDTQLGAKLDQEIESLMQQIATTVRAGNYRPKQLERDLAVGGVFKEAAEARLKKITGQVKFEQCQKLMTASIARMSDKFGRVRTAITDLCDLMEGTPTLKLSSIGEVGSIDDLLEAANIPLPDVKIPEIQMTGGQWTKLVLSYFTLTAVKAQVISDEALQNLKQTIGSAMKSHYSDFFKQMQEEIVLHFFKMFSKRITDYLRIFKDFVDENQWEIPIVLRNALEDYRVKQERVDRYQFWKGQLRQLKAQLQLAESATRTTSHEP